MSIEPNYTAASFVLAVHDIDASAAFYQDVLGFEDLNIEAPGWRFMARGPVRLQIGACPDAMPAEETGDHSYFAYLHVEDAKALHDHATTVGAELIKDLADEPWGIREFGLRTPDGHRIMIGQRLS
ncbi:MAG: VOC family protein [Pseudomonadota bacterium]